LGRGDGFLFLVMSKRPSFQFYPGDWLRDSALLSCSVGARGLWIHVICLMHEGSPYGFLKVGEKVILPANLARMAGATLPEVEGWLHELEAAGVFSRDESGCIFSRRMIRDERIRQARACGGKLGGNPALKGGGKVEAKVNLLANLQATPSSSSSSSNTPLSPPVGEKSEGPKKGRLQLRTEALMRRRESTPLSVAERKAFAKARGVIEATAEEDWVLLEEFYRAPQEETFARKDLAALLNNWNGEIDRARGWKGRRGGSVAGVPVRALAPVVEPVGWREFVALSFPDCPYAPCQPKAGAAWSDVEAAHQRMIAEAMAKEGGK
jgi:hypothetical protein